MKKYLIALFTLVFVSGANAQTEAETMDLLKSYGEIMKKGEWTKTLDYVYPALFESVPREMLEMSLEQAFNSPIFNISVTDLEVLEVSELFAEDSITYRFADYQSTLIMSFLNDSIEQEQINAMAEMMRMQMGEDAVEIAGNTLVITQRSKMAIIKQKDTKKLYVLDASPQLKPYMAAFMSEAFLSRAFRD